LDALSLAAIRRAQSALQVAAGQPPPGDSAVSLREVVKLMLSEKWFTGDSAAYKKTRALENAYGPAQDGYLRAPASTLMTRDLNVNTPSAGGFLTGSKNLGYIDALQPASVALRLGAQVVPVGVGGVAVPRGTTAASVTWQGTETTQGAENQPVFGQVVALPKIAIGFLEVSRQFLLQAENGEQVAMQELANSCATALDAAVVGGSGSAGAPLGIANTPGVGTFTGASLTYAQALNATEDVAANATNAASLGWVCPPAVATILAQRVRLAATQPFLLEGDAVGGQMLSRPLLSTANAPSGTLIFGDWASVWIAQWDGGLQLMVDPFSKFAQGIVGIRALMPIDVLVTRPAAFSVGTSVS
jgi:HK97 family phage major capsid protein